MLKSADLRRVESDFQDQSRDVLCAENIEEAISNHGRASAVVCVKWVTHAPQTERRPKRGARFWRISCFLLLESSTSSFAHKGRENNL